MKYFSTRGGSERLSFEDVRPLAPSHITHTDSVISSDRPHWTCTKRRVVHPRTHPISPFRLATEMEIPLVC